MANLKELAVGRSDILWYDPREITVEPGLNARDFGLAENLEHVAKLKASIRASGNILVPLTIRLRDSKPSLVDGECRHRAILENIDDGMDISKVPCLVEAKNTSDGQRFLDQDARNSGKAFNPIERARNYQRAINTGMSQTEVAQRVGKTPSHVSDALGLLGLPEAVQHMVADREVSASTAKATIKAEGEVAGTTHLKEAVEEARQEAAESPPSPKANRAGSTKRATVTPKKMKKDPAAPKAAKPHAQNKASQYDAMFHHWSSFLTKAQQGTYCDPADIPEKLERALLELAEKMRVLKSLGVFESDAAD